MAGDDMEVTEGLMEAAPVTISHRESFTWRNSLSSNVGGAGICMYYVYDKYISRPMMSGNERRGKR